MELVGAGFCGYIHDPGMETVFGREKVSLRLEFLNLVHRNLKGKVAGPVVARLDAVDQINRGRFPISSQMHGTDVTHCQVLRETRTRALQKRVCRAGTE